MSAVFFQFPSQEAFRTHATEWSAETTENGFKILLQTVSELCTLYNTYVFLMPYFHLSFCHMRKISQYTVFLFNFTLCTRKKKSTYLPSTVKKNSPWSEPVIITSLPTKYNTHHKSWNTCAIFAFPNIGLGIAVVPHNMQGSTLGKERGTFEWEQRCEEWM